MDKSYKFCHYLDEALDSQFKNDLTFDTFKNDIEITFLHSQNFLPFFNEFIKHQFVKEKYIKYNLNEEYHKVVWIGLNFLINLLNVKVRLKYETDKEEHYKALLDKIKITNREEFVTSMLNSNEITTTEETKNFFYQLFESTEAIRLSEHNPSITGICNLIKNVNLYFEKGTEYMKRIIENNQKASEDDFIDLFHDVFIIVLMF